VSRSLDRLDALDQDKADHFRLLERIFGLASKREDEHRGSGNLEHFRVANLIGPPAVQADPERLEWYGLDPEQDVFRTHCFAPFLASSSLVP